MPTLFVTYCVSRILALRPSCACSCISLFIEVARYFWLCLDRSTWWIVLTYSTTLEFSVCPKTISCYCSFATVPQGVTILYDFITYMQRKQLFCRKFPHRNAFSRVFPNIWCYPVQRQHYPEENLGVST